MINDSVLYSAVISLCPFLSGKYSPCKFIPHNKIQVFSNFGLNETETLLRYKVCLINASLKLLFLS